MHAGRGVKPGLERIAGLLDLMAGPHLGYPVIHVGGTNGKTSTARMAAALLSAHGLTPGLFTSPHLQVVEERFEVGGEVMSPDSFATAVADVQPFVALFEARSGDAITYFELTAALAFSWFAERAVDAAVVEVGLGGRLDATNVVDAEVAVVTSIALEHTFYLGNTLGSIAREKGGILGEGKTLVTGDLPAEAAEVVAARVADTGSTWLRWGADFGIADARPALGGWLVDLDGVYRPYPEVHLRLHGRHQATNLAAAVAAVEALFGRALDPGAVAEVAAAVRAPGRMEVVGHHPVLMLDGAHNPAATSVLVAALREEFPTTRWAVVFGAMDDKDVPSMLGLLAPMVASLHTAAAGVGRARPAAEVAALASECPGVPVSAHASVPEALLAARAEGIPVLVTGSLYVVGEARDALGLRAGR